jgi:hypothetical protein
VYALGTQLDAWNDYVALCEEDGSLNQLGKIPNVALDVITVAYGTSPISVISSVQPIDEEQGTVYFKELIAQTTRGNVTANQSIAKADGVADVSEPQGFAGDYLTESLGNTVGATQTYNLTLTEYPVRKQRVTINIATPSPLTCFDANGDGVLVGSGAYGTVNYTTGAVVLELAADPSGAYAITSTYATDFSADTDIPKVLTRLTSKGVHARVFALKDTVGLEQSYAMRRRFGMIAEDEIATDLVAAINAEVCSTAIAQLVANAVGNTNFDKAAPSGVSYFEHKQTFKDKLADAEAVMLGNAGRGQVSVIVAGRKVAAIIGTLPGFTKISDGSTMGAHIYGTLDGVTVVRAPTTGAISADVAVLIYKGASPFEAASVYAPYMPLVVTTALPTGTNPLLSQRAAAIWAAIEPLVPSFATKLTVLNA